MTNKDSRARSGRKPKLRLLDLTFDNKSAVDQLRNGTRPHGGYRGGKTHPLSPYSFNKNGEYQRKMRDDLNKMFYDEFLDGRASPGWAFDVSKEVTHSGESPFFVHGLLSTSRVDSESSLIQAQKRSTTPVSTAHPTPRKRATSYYRSTTPHQFLTATDPQSLTQSELKYGRPTRTTLLRARQRCASAPVNSYDVRREMVKKSENQPPVTVSHKEVLPAAVDGETPHAFLTGARYNRAHFLDAKSLSVYGVYMPRTNPQGIFMTGHATQKSRDKGQHVPSVPPDSPRSDVDETSQPERRPSTAPGKRLLHSSPHSRPRTAWGEHSTSVTITHNDNQKVVVTFKSAKPKGSFESVLPSVTGKTAPKMYYRKPRELSDDAVNQPPPTPASIFSVRDESERGPDQTMEDADKNLDKIKETQSDAESKTEKSREQQEGGSVGGDDGVTTVEKEDDTVPVIDIEEMDQEKPVDGGTSEESKPGNTEAVPDTPGNAESKEHNPESKPENSDDTVNIDKSETDRRQSDQRNAAVIDNTDSDRTVQEPVTSDTKSPSKEKYSKPSQENTSESLYRSNSIVTPRVNQQVNKAVNITEPSGGSEVNTNTPPSQEGMKEEQSVNQVSGPEFFITKEDQEGQEGQEGDIPGPDSGAGVTSVEVTIVEKSGENSS